MEGERGKIAMMNMKRGRKTIIKYVSKCNRFFEGENSRLALQLADLTRDESVFQRYHDSYKKVLEISLDKIKSSTGNLKELELCSTGSQQENRRPVNSRALSASSIRSRSSSSTTLLNDKCVRRRARCSTINPYL